MSNLRIVFIFILGLTVSGCSDEVTNMESLKSNFKDLPCNVFFFKSWSTYEHPVSPKEPIEYEQALKRNGFYRAWMCNQNNENMFVFFEGIENKQEISEFKKPDNEKNQIRFYNIDLNNRPDNEIPGEKTLQLDSFYASLPDIDNFLVLVKQTKGISYEYVYTGGTLKQVIITDFDGNIKTLDM